MGREACLFHDKPSFATITSSLLMASHALLQGMGAGRSDGERGQGYRKLWQQVCRIPVNMLPRPSDSCVHIIMATELGTPAARIVAKGTQ